MIFSFNLVLVPDPTGGFLNGGLISGVLTRLGASDRPERQASGKNRN